MRFDQQYSVSRWPMEYGYTDTAEQKSRNLLSLSLVENLISDTMFSLTKYTAVEDVITIQNCHLVSSNGIHIKVKVSGRNVLLQLIENNEKTKKRKITHRIDLSPCAYRT